MGTKGEQEQTYPYVTKQTLRNDGRRPRRSLHNDKEIIQQEEMTTVKIHMLFLEHPMI
jgi:hypothetical protein